MLVQVTLGGVGATKSYDLFSSTDLTNALALYCAGTKVRSSRFLRAGKTIDVVGRARGAAK